VEGALSSAVMGASVGEDASVCGRQEKKSSPVMVKQIINSNKDRRCLLEFTVVSSSSQMSFQIGYDNV
jgi:hypothetical protein